LLQSQNSKVRCAFDVSLDYSQGLLEFEFENLTIGFGAGVAGKTSIYNRTDSISIGYGWQQEK
jgi:hypothetical protein